MDIKHSYWEIFSGKKSKNFVNLKKLYKKQNIPNNLIFDKELNIIRLQPNARIHKKNRQLWKNFDYNSKSLYKANTPYQIKRNQIIKNNLPNIKKIKKILDFGAGDFSFVKLLITKLKSKTIYGYEDSFKIEKSNIKYCLQSKFMKKNPKFDLITLNWVISNSFNPQEIVLKTKKLLSKNGYLLITESNVMLNNKFPRTSDN